MDKLYAIEAFIKIVESGSITAAANALDVSQPSLVRLLAALELDLGVRLLNRTTRRMSLTDEGRDYYERSRQIVAAVEAAQLSLTARHAVPGGRLRIASSVPLGRMFVAPVVAEFLQQYPQVQIELLLLDRIVDLVEEGMDLAVRVARLPDSSMIANPVGQTRRVVVASKSLLASTGIPGTPADLRGRPCVTFTGLESPTHWDFGEGRLQARVPIKSVLVTNQIDAAVSACVEGLGFGRFFDYHVLEQVKAGQLVRVLDAFDDEPIPASVVYPSSRSPSPNVRSFVGFALPRLRQRLGELQIDRTAKTVGGRAS